MFCLGICLQSNFVRSDTLFSRFMGRNRLAVSQTIELTHFHVDSGRISVIRETVQHFSLVLLRHVLYNYHIKPLCSEHAVSLFSPCNNTKFLSVKVLKEFGIIHTNLNWNRNLLHNWQNYHPPSNNLLTKIPSGVAEVKNSIL